MGLLGFVYCAFIVVVVIQIIFYVFISGKFAFSKLKKARFKNVPVSIIICAKNEAENLKRFLPSVIEQDFPNFEIVLINDSSKDETLDVMQAFSKLHDNIKIVDVKSIEAFWGNKKYALTLGIKASKYEHLVFTDADCKPVSNLWLKEMASHFSNKKTLVLGYGAYAKIKNSFLNKVIRFETLITAVNYFSFALNGMPYMGVGRNLAYVKNEFFKVNGFIKHIKVQSGDDDLFINHVATNDNTTICVSKESFTESTPKTTFKAWFFQKRRHVSTAHHYKTKHKIILALQYVSNLSFWLFTFFLLTTLYNWPIVLGLFLTRIMVQYLVLGLSFKKLNEIDLLFLLPFLEIFLIIAQMAIFINNLISKPNHWK
ncbi:glycosyltransferase [Flavisericum labens]|uniref:glycosyltransferase n=1 Tax=Flavisericum labens TaxID=3377112 RepID=UPI00387B25DE